jgi:hypothetical protein
VGLRVMSTRIRLGDFRTSVAADWTSNMARESTRRVRPTDQELTALWQPPNVQFSAGPFGDILNGLAKASPPSPAFNGETPTRHQKRFAVLIEGEDWWKAFAGGLFFRRLLAPTVGHTTAPSPIPSGPSRCATVAAVAGHSTSLARRARADRPARPSRWTAPYRPVATASARLHLAPDAHFSTPRRLRRMPKQSNNRRAKASHW